MAALDPELSRDALAEGRSPDGIALLRRLFLVLLAGGLLIGVVTWLVLGTVGEVDARVLIAVIAMGVIGLVGAMIARRRNLDLSGEEELARSYRTAFFLGFALVDAGLLVAFVWSMVEQAIWPYLVALPFYLIGMAMIAPTDRNLDRVQERLNARGTPLSVRSALAQPNPRVQTKPWTH